MNGTVLAFPLKVSGTTYHLSEILRHPLILLLRTAQCIIHQLSSNSLLSPQQKVRINTLVLQGKNKSQKVSTIGGSRCQPDCIR
jgi:hypothetical protein